MRKLRWGPVGSALADLAHECLMQGKTPAMSLDPFTRGFIEVGLCTEREEDSDKPLRGKYTRHDIAIDSLAQIRVECLAFQQKCMPWYTGKGVYKNEMDRTIRGQEEIAGGDFWLTRAGAGAGFWDGDWLHGEELTAACVGFGSPNLYVGDDGKLHYM